MTHTRRQHDKGISLVEVTIMLSVLTLLTSVMAPSIGDYVADARMVKARADMQVIAVAIARFAFNVSTQPNKAGSWTSYDVLVGAGEIPVSTNHDTDAWVANLSSGQAGSLDDHLVTNAAAYARRGSQFGGGMFSRGWAGPYISTGVGPDPWGNRYAVSVRHMADDSGSSTVVLSAGSNGTVETPFNGRNVANSDDLVVVIAGSSR